MLANLSVFFLNYLNYISGILVSVFLVYVAIKAIKRVRNKKIDVIFDSYMDSYGNVNMRKIINYKGSTHILESILEDKDTNDYYTVIDNKKVFLNL
jgi:peroxiredoxin family protein